MCGLFALAGGGPASTQPQAVATAAMARLRHRGPDQQAWQARPGGVLLVSTRLAILDVPGGAQPMATEDGHHAIAYNGEVFNHAQLRDELRAQGISFHGRSDTEVVLKALATWGAAALDRLDGQFALVFHDSASGRVLAARDRFGICPLFYTLLPGGGVALASEIKAFAAIPGFAFRLDPLGIQQVAHAWATLPPATAFAGVRELPIGHWLEFQSGEGASPDPVIRRYYDLAAQKPAPAFSSLAEAVEGMRDLLAAEVRRQMMADVPVGAYLSGGIDSTVLTYLAAQAAGSRLRTFSIAFDQAEFDESSAQAEASAFLGVANDTLRIGARDIADSLPGAVWHAEKPLFRTAPVPLFLLSRLCRDQGIKVVLSGEGSDEVFLGYDTYRELKIRLLWSRLPDSEWRPRLLQKIFPYLPQFSDPRAFAFLKGFYRRGLEDVSHPLYPMLPRLANGATALAFMSPEARIEGERLEACLVEALPDNIADLPPMQRAQLIEQQTLLPGYLLSSQGDRMLAAHSVEGRFPYLGRGLVEALWSLPDIWKLNGLTDKQLLRRAFAGLIPESIRLRPKFAYRAPDIASFFPDPPEYVRALMAPDAVAEAGLFDPAKVGGLMRKLEGWTPGTAMPAKDSLAFVWMLTTQLLHHQYVKGNGVQGG